jgi:FkbM family methyltransferase
VFGKARYALFDPLPENVEALSELVAEHPSFAFWSGAIGAATTRLPLKLHGHQTSFYDSTDFAGLPLEVDVRTLDSFIESMGFRSPMLLKADVQGYELEVLRGASRCLQMTELLLLEVSFKQIYDGGPLAHEVIAECGHLGYRIYDICTYAQRPRDGALAQADVLFVKRESPLLSFEGWA